MRHDIFIVWKTDSTISLQNTTVFRAISWLTNLVISVTVTSSVGTVASLYKSFIFFIHSLHDFIHLSCTLCSKKTKSYIIF